ncbi:MAG: zf-HC2 domain-containing protein [Tepidisphaeraceae bacterium]|jgi:anti-sigma factor RsiW
MASCPTSEQLSAFHDGEIDEVRRVEIERHLRQCPLCGAEMERLQAISRLLGAAPAAKLLPIGLHRLHRRVDQAMEEGLLRFVRVLNTIAACVLIAGSACLMVKTRENQTVQSPMPAAPPWVGVDVAETSDSPSGAASTPAAAWYLAEDSSRGDDSP